MSEVEGKTTAVVVNATDLEYITTVNPTSSQLNDLRENGNIGLDTRPARSYLLRLRSPNPTSSND